jgi:hypothetical protein
MSVAIVVKMEIRHEALCCCLLLLLGSVAAAKADKSSYDDMRKQQRGDDALNVDAEYCDQRVGAVMNGDVTPPQQADGA